MSTYDPTGPGAYPFSSSTAISGDDIEDLLVNNVNPEYTLGLINGGLGSDNVAGSLVVEAEHLQKGAWVRAIGVASTLDLDYFVDAFSQGSVPNLPSTIDKPIPGASIRWYQPWDGAVLLLWNVFWTNNASTIDGEEDVLEVRSDVYLTMDDAYIGQCHRSIWACVGHTSYEHEGFRKSRVYAGHWVDAEVARGWHTASIRMHVTQAAHTKVWARHMIAIPLKETPQPE